MGAALSWSRLFLVGTLAFVATMFRTGEVLGAACLYTTGPFRFRWRFPGPQAVLDLGLAAMAVGIGWIAISLLGRAAHITPWASDDAPGRRSHVSDLRHRRPSTVELGLGLGLDRGSTLELRLELELVRAEAE